jgi:hypothetical protein
MTVELERPEWTSISSITMIKKEVRGFFFKITTTMEGNNSTPKQHPR